MVEFNAIPETLRTPGVFIEIDAQNAQQGPTIQAYRALVVGQQVSGTALTPFRATNADAVGAEFGRGSIIHQMAKAWFGANKSTEVHFLGVADDGGATAATFTLTVTGTATAAGTLFLYIDGRRFEVGVANADDANAIAAAINTKLGTIDDLSVTAAVVTNVVTLTARNAGTVGNGVDARFNLQEGEEFPAGVSVAAAAGVAGATDPSTSGLFANLGNVQYHVMAGGLSTAAFISAFEAELATRFGPLLQQDGNAIFALDDTHSNLVTFGDARNSQHSTIVGIENSPTPFWELAAVTAGVVAFHGQQDPGRPFQTLELPNVVAPAIADRFTQDERNLLLFDGISTIVASATGATTIERLITTFQTNASGGASDAFLRLNTMLTLSYLRFDFAAQYGNRFPRHKLANDGTRFGPGQPVMTPSIGKAFALGVFRGWEDLALVEGFTQFKQDLLVERSSTDPDRLEFVLAPDLINQLRVTGVQIAFLL